MNTVFAFVCVSMLAYAVVASPCTDSCAGSCGIVKQACDFTGLLGNLCDVNFGVCSNSCNAVCNCVDTCSAECGGKNAECAGDGYNFLQNIQCQVEFGDCMVICQTKCAANTAAAAIGQLAGGGAK